MKLATHDYPVQSLSKFLSLDPDLDNYFVSRSQGSKIDMQNKET